MQQTSMDVFWQEILDQFKEHENKPELVRVASYINQQAERIQFSQFKNKDLLYINYLQDHISKALKKIKSGLLHRAEADLLYCHRIFDNYKSPDLSDKHFHFCFQPVWGYLEYKKKNYKQAVKAMNKALVSSQFFYEQANKSEEQFFYKLQRCSFQVNKARLRARLESPAIGISLIEEDLDVLQKMIDQEQYSDNFVTVMKVLGCQFYGFRDQLMRIVDD